MDQTLNFQFNTANQIVFGCSTAKRLPELASTFGKRVILVAGSGHFPIEDFLLSLQNAGFEVSLLRISGEPDLAAIQAGLDQVRSFQPQLVIGIGGGSVLDTAKSLAVLAANPGELIDYLEVVGQGLPLSQPGLPMLALPTTAGTGAEVTRNAVISVPEKGLKVSLRSPYLMPSLAIVDPLLTLSSPPQVTAASGMDALTQNLEAFVSKLHNPLVDLISLEGLRLAAQSLRIAYNDPQNIPARQDMCLSSLFGGFSLANAGLGAVHGFAGVLGGMYGASHGALCAALLPAVVKVNLQAVQRSGEAPDYLSRFLKISQALHQNPNVSPQDAHTWLQQTQAALNLQPLSAMGVPAEDFPEIIAKSQSSSSMKKNPVVLTESELRQILEESF